MDKVPSDITKNYTIIHTTAQENTGKFIGILYHIHLTKQIGPHPG